MNVSGKIINYHGRTFLLMRNAMGWVCLSRGIGHIGFTALGALKGWYVMHGRWSEIEGHECFQVSCSAHVSIQPADCEGLARAVLDCVRAMEVERRKHNDRENPE